MDDVGDLRITHRTRSGQALLMSCHPVPSLGVTAVAVLLSLGVGLPAGRVALLGAAVLAGQLSIGWSNDRIDAGRDAAAGRRDKPAAAGRVTPVLLTAAAGLALTLAIALSLALGTAAALALLTLVAAGWAYNLGVKSTAWSGLAYVVGFGALPLAPYLARTPDRWPAWWVPVAGGLLGLGAHFANVLPDLADDAATGVRGLPHRLGARNSTITMGLTLAAATVVLAFGPSRPVPLAAGTTVVGVVAALAVMLLALRRPDSAAAFRLTIVLALLDVALVVALA